MLDTNRTEKMEGAITGRVATMDGLPIAGAVVMITGDSPRHRDIAALTNDEGIYLYNDLLVGRYTLLVSATGYLPNSKQTRVESGQVTRLDFSLAK